MEALIFNESEAIKDMNRLNHEIIFTLIIYEAFMGLLLVALHFHENNRGMTFEGMFSKLQLKIKF